MDSPLFSLSSSSPWSNTYHLFPSSSSPWIHPIPQLHHHHLMLVMDSPHSSQSSPLPSSHVHTAFISIPIFLIGSSFQPHFSPLLGFTPSLSNHHLHSSPPYPCYPLVLDHHYPLHPHPPLCSGPSGSVAQKGWPLNGAFRVSSPFSRGLFTLKILIS